MNLSTDADASAQAKLFKTGARMMGERGSDVRKKVQMVFDGYAAHVTKKRPPLASYAALMSTFGAIFGTALVRGAKKNRLPRMSAGDIGLVGVATVTIAHTLARDEVTSFLRAPFVTYKESAGAGEVDEETRREGLGLAIGQLLTCPYCLSPWSASTLVTGLAIAPRATKTVAAVAASVAASYALNQGYAALRKVA